MQNIESLKRSIGSAEDLAGVVRTMKTLAAVNIHQYEAAAESLNVYAATIRGGLSMLLRNDHRSLNRDSSDRDHTGAVVFGTDQGMCGQFNEQIARFASDTLPREAVPGVPVICIGHRTAASLTAVELEPQHVLPLPGSAEGTTRLVQDLLPVIDSWRNAHRVSRILVFHNRRLSASAWRPHSAQLLPLQLAEFRKRSPETVRMPGRSLPLWTMSTDVLFSRLVKQFLFASLFRACAESQAGENASRIAAMQAAERNIRERLEWLRSDYAQLRQTAITEELLDVVTGFEALNENN